MRFGRGSVRLKVELYYWLFRPVSMSLSSLSGTVEHNIQSGHGRLYPSCSRSLYPALKLLQLEVRSFVRIKCACLLRISDVARGRLAQKLCSAGERAGCTSLHGG